MRAPRPSLLLCALLAACGSSRRPESASAQPAVIRPSMLLTATATIPADAAARFVGAQPGTSPRVLVLSAGSDTAAGPRAAPDLRSAGAIATSIRVTRPMAESGQISALLNGVTAVWFTGSRADELGAALGGTPTAAAIERSARAGTRIGGDGSGAGIVSAVFITGGDVPAPRRRRGRRPPDEEGVATAEGIGILRGALVYAPSSASRRDSAITEALASHPSLLGIQLDSGAALMVMQDGVWESVGETDVLVLVRDPSAPVDSVMVPPDSTGAPADSAAPSPWRTRILSPGSRFDPRSRTLLPLAPATDRR